MNTRVVKTVVVALALLALAACKRQEAPKLEAIDPNKELQATNADIAKRLADQNAEVEAKNAAAREATDRQRADQASRQGAEAALNAVATLKSKWDGLLNEANKTPATEFAGLLGRMDGVKTEVQQIKGDECSEPARITLLAGISQGYDTYREFSAANVAPTPAVQKKLDDSRALVERAESDLQACRR